MDELSEPQDKSDDQKKLNQQEMLSIRKRIKFLVKKLNENEKQEKREENSKDQGNGIVIISNPKSLDSTIKIIEFYQSFLKKDQGNTSDDSASQTEIDELDTNHNSSIINQSDHKNEVNADYLINQNESENNLKMEIFFIENEMIDHRNETNMLLKKLESVSRKSRSFLTIELKTLNFSNDYFFLQNQFLLFRDHFDCHDNSCNDTFRCVDDITKRENQEVDYFVYLMNYLTTHYGNHNYKKKDNICHSAKISVEKPYYFKQLAILQSSFENILFLDADNILLQNPSFLFNSKQFSQSGLVLWSDFFLKKTPLETPIYKITDTGFRIEYERESGQLLINKLKHRKTLELSLYLTLDPEIQKNRILLYGDKDTFELAARLFQLPTAVIPYNILSVGEWNQDKGHACGYGVMQKWFDGSPLFIHAIFKKIHFCSRLDHYSEPYYHPLGITWDDWCIRFKSGSSDKRLDETWPHIFTKEYLDLTSSCLYF